MESDQQFPTYNPGSKTSVDVNEVQHSVSFEQTTENNLDGTTILPFPNTTTLIPIEVEVCQKILFQEIGHSRVRIWDLIILIPNTLFLLFLIYKAKKAVVKLRHTSSPIFSAFYALVSLVAVISVLRCIVSMTVNATLEAGDIADKILWLVLRFFLLATELSVVVFGLAFGHLESHKSIRRVLLITFFMSLVYSTTQGVLEFKFPDERFHVKHDDEEFDMFGHGGMLFWFASSVFFFIVYSIICILPLINKSCDNRFALPTRKAFYMYCGFLTILNVIQAIGSGMLHYYVKQGLCIVNATTYIYFTCFAPLVYATFLYSFFKDTRPSNIMFSYKSHVDDLDEDYSGQFGAGAEHYAAPPGASSTESLNDHMSQSIDSTHFDHALSPNPLYDADVPYIGDHAELSINSAYFGHPTSSFDAQDKEMNNPVA